MGTSESVQEKSSVDLLCQTFMLSTSENSSGASMIKMITSSLQNVLRDIENVKTREKTMRELSDTKGIPAILGCLNKKIPGEFEGNIVQCEALKIFYQMMVDDKKKYDMLFDNEIIQVVNKLALSNNSDYRSIGTKIISLVSDDKTYIDKLESVNPLYTLNMVVSSPSTDNLTKLEALTGIKNLANKFKKELLNRGIVNTLANILLDAKPPNEPIAVLTLNCLGIVLEEKNVCIKLIEDSVIDKVKLYLSYKSPSLLASSAQCMQAMCNFEIGRACINKEDLVCLQEISKSNDQEASLSAKSALLALCLMEEKLAYFKKHGWIDDIFSAFKETKTHQSRMKLSNTLKQLSRDCMKYTLYDLYQSVCDPAILLVQDSNNQIQNRSLSVLLKIVMRGDLQIKLGELNCSRLLISSFQTFNTLKERLNCIVILALISNNYLSILEDVGYVDFFIAMANKTRQEIASDCKKEKPDTAELEMVEEIAKISMITCIAVPEQYVQTDMKSKIKFLCSQCRSQSHFIRCRAAGTLSILASNYQTRSLLVSCGMIDELLLLIKDKNDGVICQAAKALASLSTRPEGLELWLKFDSTYVVDAANLHVPEQTISITTLKKNTGLYNTWGKEFKTGDAIPFRDIPFMKSWTVSVWFRTPFPKHKGPNVLIQGRTGAGAIVAVFKNAVKSYDQKTGIFVTLWDGVSNLEKGWHHLAVLRNENGIMEVYVDGINQPDNAKNVTVLEPMKFFGSNKVGNEPFGTICDLRLYPRLLSYTETKALAKYNDNIIDGLPDSMIEYVNICDGVSYLVQSLPSATDLVKLEISQTLANLSIKASCRASILRNNGLPYLIDCLNSKNPYLRTRGARCLVNLA